MKQFKKAVSLVLVLTMIAAMFSMNFAQASAAGTAVPLLGDVDKDGKVDIYDASAIQKSLAHIGGSLNYDAMDHSRVEFRIADVDKDGKIDIFDASLIQKWMAGDAKAQTYGIGQPLDTETPTDAPSTEVQPTEPQPTGEPETEQPTAEPSTDAPGEITDGYYMVGTLNGVDCWQDNLSADRQLKANPDAENEYMLDWTFYDGDAIKVVKVENGEVTAWYNDTDGDNYVLTAAGGKTGLCTVYFNPTGETTWSYKYITVQPMAEPATGEPSTDEPTPGEITDGYYLIGIINGVKNWQTVDASNKLAKNPASENEYMLDKTFADGDAIKVVKVENGEITAWFKDGMDNEYKLTAEGGKTGLCTVYFNPTGETTWSYKYITVQPKGDQPGDEPGTDEPAAQIEDGYYVIGNYIDWKLSELTAADKLAKNPASENEYMLDKTFKDGDAIKVVEVKDGVIVKWFKDGMNNEYKLTAEGGKTGLCTVYFNPTGETTWSYKYITVQSKGDEPGDEPATGEPATTAADVEDGYYIIGIIGGVKNWQTVDAANKLSANPGTEGEYMLEKTFADGDAIKAVEVKDGAIVKWFKDGMDNEYKLTAEGGKTGDCTVYFNPNGNSAWSYTYLTVLPKTVPSTDAPSTDAPLDAENGYYLIGIINGDKNWQTVDASNKFAANPIAENEYMLEKTFADGDAIKVVEVKDGAIVKWFKEGMDNEYKLTAEGGKTGLCTVYFNPTGETTWSYKYITVQPKTVPATDAPSTEAPAVEIEDGYYVIGNYNNWDIAELTAADKLAENPASENEYMLEKTFADGDAIKVVEVKDGAIVAWFKDGMNNEYKLTAEGGKTGLCTVYFNPTGETTWSYKYITVQSKGDQPGDEPATGEPATTAADVEDGYYIIGIIGGVKNWQTVDAANKLSANPGTEGEYMLEKTFADGDAIKAVEVKDGAIVNWFKSGMDNEYVLTAEGGKTGDCTVYFNPNGNSAWSYTYLTVQPKTVPTTDAPSTDAPSTEAPSTDAPSALADGYYMVGTLNGVNCWAENITADRQLKANPGAENEYMLDWTFYDGDEIKVVKVENGKVTAWYNNTDGDNYVLTAEGGKTGDCTVYFNPTGETIWTYKYITVQPKTVPTTDAPSTDAPSTDAPSTQAPSTEAPAALANGYYVIGNYIDWNIANLTEADKLVANPNADGEYMLDKTFKDNDAIKVVEIKNGEAVNWFKNGMGDEYKLTAEGGKTGECTVYFNPNGNDKWSYTYLTVLPKTVPTTDAPSTDAPSTDAPSTDAPSTEAPSTEAPSTEAPSTEAPSTEAPSTEAPANVLHTYVYTISSDEKISSFDANLTYNDDIYDFDSAEYPLDDKISNFLYRDATDPREPSFGKIYMNFSIQKESKYYDMKDGVVLITLKLLGPATAKEAPVMTIKDLATFVVIENVSYPVRPDYSWTETFDGVTISTGTANTGSGSAPSTDAPSTLADGFYLISSEKDWDVAQLTAEDKFAVYSGAEYKLTAPVVKGAGYKVVKIENGEATAWYPDGMGKEYTADESHSGTPDIYFQETSKEEWAAFGGYFWMSEPNAAPATEAPATEAPATEAPTTAPATEAPKSYVYLNPNLWNQNAGERYELYVWGNGKDAKWLTATKISDSKYQFEIPDGYTSGILVREDGSKPAGNWDSKWNQTEDLTLTGNIGKTYTVNSWDQPCGSWS